MYTHTHSLRVFTHTRVVVPTHAPLPSSIIYTRYACTRVRAHAQMHAPALIHARTCARKHTQHIFLSLSLTGQPRGFVLREGVRDVAHALRRPHAQYPLAMEHLPFVRACVCAFAILPSCVCARARLRARRLKDKERKIQMKESNEERSQGGGRAWRREVQIERERKAPKGPESACHH